MTEKELLFEPDWLSPPGDTIADVLEERGWSQVEFAQRIGYTPKHVNQLLRGKAPISEDTALRLERVLGSTARFWLQRETEYREALARRAEAVTLSSESSWLGELPLDDMIRFKWITDYRHNPAAQVGGDELGRGVLPVVQGPLRDLGDQPLLLVAFANLAEGEPEFTRGAKAHQGDAYTELAVNL